MAAIENLVLGGVSTEHTDVSTAAENRVAAVTLASQAQRTLHLFSRDLDALVYDTVAFVDAATALATRSRYSFIHILLQDADKVAKQGHRLMELCYRLDSRVKLRKPAYEHKNFNEAFLVADSTGVLHRRVADRYDGMVDFNGRRRARELVKFFDDVWGRSDTHAELRRLHL
jgi:hypothetical protein